MRSMGVTVLASLLHTYAVLPFGVMAMAQGKLNPLMGVPATGVGPVRSMGMTVLALALHTYALGVGAATSA